MKTIKIKKNSQPPMPVMVKYCDTFLDRFMGLMFSSELGPMDGIVLVEKKESQVNTAIHMMFVNYDITVLWLDKNKKIVDKIIAKRWITIHKPVMPAQYVVELHKSRFDDYAVGEQLIFDET